MTKTIKGNLIMEEDMTFDENLIVEGNVSGKDGNRFNLVVKGDLDCRDLNCLNLNCLNLNCWDLNCLNLNCWDLNCLNLDCRDLNCRDLDCRDLDCLNLDCWNLNCKNLNCKNLSCDDLNCRNLIFTAVAVAYYSFRCKTWKARRTNYVIKCLDGEIVGEEAGK